MFKNIFGKSNKPNKNPTLAIYDDYKAAIESKLVSWGFNVSENKDSISGVTKYKLGELEVILAYDRRDAGVYLYARSGKKISAKGRMDEMATLLEKKPANYEDVENKLIDKNDISVALGGSDDEKHNLIRDLENWHLENS